MIEKIRKILRDHGRLNTDALALATTADLYQAGMTSHASVNVMLALEGEFEIDFNAANASKRTTTTKNTTGLLMEAMRLMDEASRDEVSTNQS